MGGNLRDFIVNHENNENLAPHGNYGSQSGGLVSQGGSEGCVFRNPNPPVSPPVYTRGSGSRGNAIYQFQCLPFGLSSAPWVFTKTLKPALALLREMGVRLIAYIDDILIQAESRELARSHAEGLVYLLQCLGFKINQKKSVLEQFLGLTVDTVQLPAGAETPTRENKKRFVRSHEQ